MDALVVNHSSVSSPGLTPERFADLLAPYSNLFENQKSVAVAVSGGADSMALCLLTKAWASHNNFRLVALTVNHNLRVEAAKEAQQVAGWLEDRSIEHHVLTWDGEKPSAGIQAKARHARYDLMASWCHENGVPVLMMAHHLEDQVETFLLRLERGSGPDGLACMAPVSALYQISLLRPLLQIPKQNLRKYLADQDQNWIEDPSNQNSNYRRVKMRKLLQKIEERGVSAVRLAQLVDQFSQLKDQLAGVVDIFIKCAVKVFPEGYCLIQAKLLQKLPEPILERVLIRLTSLIGGKAYPPRSVRLTRVVKSIQDANFSGFTFNGCRLGRKDHEIMICRENRRRANIKVKSGDTLIWDNLFSIKIGGSLGKGAQLTHLGKGGWVSIAKKSPELKENPLPYAVKVTLPALFDGDEVLQVPHLNYDTRDADEGGLRVVDIEFGRKFSH